MLTLAWGMMQEQRVEALNQGPPALWETALYCALLGSYWYRVAIYLDVPWSRSSAEKATSSMDGAGD